MQQPGATFTELLNHILDNVLISSDVEQTCYFPSFPQLHRMFLLYAGDRIA